MAGRAVRARRLWTHVFRLKQALVTVGEGEVSVVRQGDGYVLAGPVVVDSHRFGELVRIEFRVS